MPITNSQQMRNLKATLDNVVTDGEDFKTFHDKLFKKENMSDAYVDDAETAGPPFAYEVVEAEEAPSGEFFEGPATRYWARKFGLQMRISEEALDDGKEKKYIDCAKRIRRALKKTKEIDAANVFNRATDTNYTYGDGLPLSSTAHTLPGGGTFSNRFAAFLTPGRAALIAAQTAIGLFPGHDGNVGEAIMGTKVACHYSQWGVWDGILMSGQVPESANNEVNVVNRNSIGFKPTVIASPYFSSTTFWGVITDVEVGLRWLTRKKMTSKTYDDEGGDVVIHKVAERWARGCSDPRAFYLGST